MKHRYTLAPYKGIKSRHTCPACGSKHNFTRYIDTETGAYLADHVGCCNRINKCGYHYKPREYFEERKASPAPSLGGETRSTNRKQQYTKQHLLSLGEDGRGFPHSTDLTTPQLTTLMNNSFSDFGQNRFARFLVQVLGMDAAHWVLNRYHIGTHHHWQGSTVFWQVDEQERVRAGKVMLYNDNGKRVRQPFNHVTWIHSIEKIGGYEMQQCFFGQHLLQGNTKPIAITESEKTAVLAAAFLPQFTWMAAGSCSNLTVEKLEALQGHRIILYPDLGAEDKWAAIASKVEQCSVSRLLTHYSTDQHKADGRDLADYLTWYLRHYTW